MSIVTTQEFAEAIFKLAADKEHALDLTKHETQVNDYWTYRADSEAMPGGGQCLVAHGSFDAVFTRTIVLPKMWDDFCLQFLSPEARLLMSIHRECQKPSWLTWRPDNTARDALYGAGNSRTDQDRQRIYNAVLDQLKERGLTTGPSRRYRAVGVQLTDGVLDLPRDYEVFNYMVDELHMDGERYGMDMPHIERKYGDSKPVLHMVGNTIDLSKSTLHKAASESASPKAQSIAYVLSESRGSRLIPRRVGSMTVSILEIAYRAISGAILGDLSYLTPNDLSQTERGFYSTDSINWEWHCKHIVKPHPQLAALLGMESDALK
jgi:hypothetical protein